ncbi:MAG: prepilin-type N-terminal cleavage/methylation domain-containing protein, partial [Nitrososphaera sp.]|nr:prepilin-type N-terminal cleavage/methylation domain-containing protein [Nitrososphaera sp.]
TRGFTLIELLVVIAIIGILASIVLASLNSARIKGRDARRIADLNQLQKALTLYYDDNSQQYPETWAGLGTAFIASIPTDPVTAVQYDYAAITDGVGTECITYHLGATLEQASNPALNNDRDAAVSADPVCGASAADFDGTVATTYDLVP